jgi:hypothetical protein
VQTLTWANEVLVKELDAAYAAGDSGPLPKGTRGMYVLRKGESLSRVAKAFYGDPERWKDIVAANKDKIPDPDMVKAGRRRRQQVTIDDHAVVQAPNDVAAGALEQEGEDGVAQTGQATDEHVRGETRGMAPVLKVALAHAVQMLGEVFHGDKSMPISWDNVSKLTYLEAL